MTADKSRYVPTLTLQSPPKLISALLNFSSQLNILRELRNCCESHPESVSSPPLSGGPQMLNRRKLQGWSGGVIHIGIFNCQKPTRPSRAATASTMTGYREH